MTIRTAVTLTRNQTPAFDEAHKDTNNITIICDYGGSSLLKLSKYVCDL